MMNKQDAKPFFLLQRRQYFAEARALRLAEAAGGNEQRRRYRGRKADKHEIPAPTQVGKTGSAIIAAHIGHPLRRVTNRLAYIGIVIARDEADVVQRAQLLQPFAPAD